MVRIQHKLTILTLDSVSFLALSSWQSSLLLLADLRLVSRRLLVLILLLLCLGGKEDLMATGALTAPGGQNTSSSPYGPIGWPLLAASKTSLKVLDRWWKLHDGLVGGVWEDQTLLRGSWGRTWFGSKSGNWTLGDTWATKDENK